MFRKPCVHRKRGLPSPPWNDCNGEFQEGGDGLQEEPQLHHRPNMEIPKVGDLVKGRDSGHCLMCPYVFLLNFRRFSEFVDYVLGKDLRYDDEHWSPYFKECTPCHINFTFVGLSLLIPFAAVTVFGFRPL